MTYTLTIGPEAEVDIAGAYGYYQSCRLGLGSDFVLCVEEALERITRNPLIYREIYSGVRRAMVHRFPYGVFFVVVEHRVIVLAVMGAARDPEHWQTRA